MTYAARLPNTSNLIQRSMQRLETLRPDRIRTSGIKRDPENYHITVMYPPLKAMDVISEDVIFHNVSSEDKEFTLYVHIPFCTGKCTFCYFYQIEKPDPELISHYLVALKKEIRLLSEKLRTGEINVNLKSMFFGGGSPTVLSQDQFTDLMDHIRGCFHVPDSSEITVEIHPEIIHSNGYDLLETYADNGVNRLNIGVQSFDNRLLKLTNRRHTAEDVIKIYTTALLSGISNINLDLLYPLPDLTPEIWESTLDRAFHLEPQSVTTYFTAFKKSSPIYKMFQHSNHRFPGDYDNHLFRVMAMEKASDTGYDYRKLIDWYVKPGDDFHYQHQKNEVRKIDNVQLISAGSGVFSYLNHFQYYNYPDIRTYIEMLHSDKLPVWKGIHLSERERLTRAVVLGIKSGTLNIQNLEKNFNVSVKDQFYKEFKHLEALGLINLQNDTVSLTDRGVLFADEVAVRFISQDIRKKLIKRSLGFDPEMPMIDTYNFMYEIDGMEV